MAKANNVIISEINSFIVQHGGNYSDWYVGIASDPRQRLFSDHNVNENNDWWIYREAFDSNSARLIEDYFINTLKTDGDTGGGDDTTKYVYAYKKSNSTIE